MIPSLGGVNTSSIDNYGFIQVTNPARLLILKDLYDNEVASFYRYPIEFQKEALQMKKESIVFFDSSLFSKPDALLATKSTHSFLGLLFLPYTL